LKNELQGATGMCRIENQTRQCLILAAQGADSAPCLRGLKNVMDGVFQQTVSAIGASPLFL